jgi:hypothetical protein
MDRRSNINLIIRWGRINSAFFLGVFFTVGLLSLLFPLTMLSLFAKWASLLSSFGAKAANQFTSSFQMFVHILQRNAIAALIYFIIGFLLQAPLAMLFSGAFYAFIVFLAPHAIGRAFGVFDWLLITVEVLALVVSTSLSSGFASVLYQVEPTVSDWWRYSKKSWRSLSMKAPISWRDPLPTWLPILLSGVFVIVGMLLFVAWFEVYGY